MTASVGSIREAWLEWPTESAALWILLRVCYTEVEGRWRDQISAKNDEAQGQQNERSGKTGRGRNDWEADQFQGWAKGPRTQKLQFGRSRKKMWKGDKTDVNRKQQLSIRKTWMLPLGMNRGHNALEWRALEQARYRWRRDGLGGMALFCTDRRLFLTTRSGAHGNPQVTAQDDI